jgi:AP-1 complex subunit gamma-1
LIEHCKGSILLEIQQRSCEYTALSSSMQPQNREVFLQKMPPLEAKMATKQESAPQTEVRTTSVPKQEPKKELLDDLFSGPSTNNHTSNNSSSGSTGLEALLAPSSTPSQKVATADILDLFGPSPPSSSSNSIPSSQPFSQSDPTGLSSLMSNSGGVGGPMSVVAYNNNGILITFDLSKQGNLSVINAHCSTSLSFPLSNFSLQVAVPKYVKLLQLGSPPTTILPPSNSGRLTFHIKLQNSLAGQKPVLMKLRIHFTNPTGQEANYQADFSNFPPNF